jgi:hypothetical protein
MTAMRQTTITIIAVLCAPSLLLVCLDACSSSNRTRHFKTTTGFSLDECKVDIQKYAMIHNALPTYEMKDCWENPIRCSVDSNGMVTLASYGADNKPGGEGNDADCVGIYPSRQSDGKWSDESVPWTQDPVPSSATISSKATPSHSSHFGYATGCD